MAPNLNFCSGRSVQARHLRIMSIYMYTIVELTLMDFLELHLIYVFLQSLSDIYWNWQTHLKNANIFIRINNKTFPSVIPARYCNISSTATAQHM